MDYLEGFLIGPIWSDTEYQTKRHIMVHVLLATAVAALYAALLLVPRLRPIVLGTPLHVSAVVFVLLMFLTPFISSFYYRVNRYFRPFLLIFYILMYVFGIITLMHLVLPLYQPDMSALMEKALQRINGRIDLTTSWFAGLEPMFSMVSGIIAGGLWLVGEGVLIALGLIAVPLLLFAAVKGWRQAMDWLIVKAFFSDLRRRR